MLLNAIYWSLSGPHCAVEICRFLQCEFWKWQLCEASEASSDMGLHFSTSAFTGCSLQSGRCPCPAVPSHCLPSPLSNTPALLSLSTNSFLPRAATTDNQLSNLLLDIALRERIVDKSTDAFTFEGLTALKERHCFHMYHCSGLSRA